MINVVKKYLDKSGYASHKEDFNELVLSHPNYPSIYAITDSLAMLSIENVALKVPKDQLAELPELFAGMYKTELVLVEKTQKGITIENEKKEKIQLSQEAFLNDWDGVILAMEPKPVSLSENRKKTVSFLGPAAIIGLVVAAFFLPNMNLWSYCLLLTSLVGTYLGVLIIRERLGYQNDLVSKFCNNDSLSCSSVITGTNNSKWLDFADLPLLFFGTSVMALLFAPADAAFGIGLLSIGSLPIVGYSLYLQKFQLKKWCLLCLLTSVVLLSQAALFYLIANAFNLLAFNYSALLVSVVLVVSLWLFSKPVLEKGVKSEKNIRELKKFKRNYAIFNFLTKGLEFENEFGALTGIYFGNGDADAEFTLILSPSCGHCHKAFQEGMALYQKFPDRVSLRVLFNVNPNNPSNPYLPVVENLAALNRVDPEKAKLALIDWHGHTFTLDSWLQKWTLPTDDLKGSQDLQQQYDWCVRNNFNYTPVKIINGRQFPNGYELSEMRFFLKEIAADRKKQDQLVCSY